MGYFISGLFFGGNAIKFVTTEGSQHPLLSSLFKMIISLVCLIFVFHRKYAKFMMGQTKIEEFFLIDKWRNFQFFSIDKWRNIKMAKKKQNLIVKK